MGGGSHCLQRSVNFSAVGVPQNVCLGGRSAAPQTERSGTPTAEKFTERWREGGEVLHLFDAEEPIRQPERGLSPAAPIQCCSRCREVPVVQGSQQHLGGCSGECGGRHEVRHGERHEVGVVHENMKTLQRQ